MQIEPKMARNIDSLNTGYVGKNWGFSGTHRTYYISKNLNIYPILTRAELLITLCYEIPCTYFNVLFIGDKNLNTKYHISTEVFCGCFKSERE